MRVGIDPGDHCFRPRVVFVRGLLELQMSKRKRKVYDPEMTFNVPGYGETLTLSLGATLAERWSHEPHPISNQRMGLGSPHHAGR